MKTIFSTKNGRTYSCPACPCVHLEYKNFILRLSKKNFETFRRFVFAIRPSACIAASPGCSGKRKIVIELQDSPMRLAFTRREFAELKLLLEGTEGMIRLREFAGSVQFMEN